MLCNKRQHFGSLCFFHACLHQLDFNNSHKKPSLQVEMLRIFALEFCMSGASLYLQEQNVV